MYQSTLASLSAAGNVLLTLFSGVLAIVLWESVLKPRRERRNIARAIATETSQNLQLLFAQAHARFEGAGLIPRDFHLSRLAFDAVSDRIVELPPDALGKVVRLYGLVDYLNDLVPVYSDMVDRRREAPKDAAYLEQLEREINAAIESFNTNLDVAFDAANAANRALHKAGEPWWSREKFVEIDGTEIKNRVTERLNERRRNLAG